MFAKIEKQNAKKIIVIIQKIMQQKIVAIFKQNSKIKFNKFLKLFKFEKFAINFNSTSTKTRFERILY